MHPFQFTQCIIFVCADPDSSFVFDPAKNNSFHWYGKALDKLGTYAIIKKEELHLELVWNYGRERGYTVLSFKGSGDAMTSFTMKDHKTSKLYLFTR